MVAAQGDAVLSLEPSVPAASNGEEFAVDIKLENPDLQNIISVRSWLEYDPALLEAVAVETKDSAFTLAAPGEDNVSASEGLIKIGRSNIEGGFSEPETVVATIRFKVLAQFAGNAEISFFDYQISELGHTSVNIIDAGFPLNILSEEPEGLQFPVNPSGPTFTPEPVAPEPVVTPTPQPSNPLGGGTVFESGLIRPLNLRANTGSGYIDLVWDVPEDLARVGFNVYYGKTSGQYTRRRSIGNVNNYRLDGLVNNETYFLAITAYDQLNRESDYSNEVGIIVGQPLSSTAPFESDLLARVPMQPQNGPLVWWLAFSSFGLSLSVLAKRKQKLVPVRA